MPKTWRWSCLLLCCHGLFSCCTSMSATCPCLQLYYPHTHHHRQSFNTHLIYLSFKKTLFISSVFIFIFKNYLKKLFFILNYFLLIFLYFYIEEWKKLKKYYFNIFTSELFFEKQSQLFICFKTCVIAVKYVYQNRFLFKNILNWLFLYFFYYLTHNNYLLIVFEM